MTLSSLALLVLLVDSLRLRSRASGLVRLPDDGEADPDSVIALVPAGMPPLSLAQRRAAAAQMERQGLALLDLWPSTLSTDVTLDLLAAVDPRSPSPTGEPTMAGLRGLRSARRAVVLRPALADRLLPEERCGLSPAALEAVVSDLSLAGLGACGVAVLAEEGPPIERPHWDPHTEPYALRVAWLGALGLTLGLNPLMGVLLTVSWMFRPAIVLGESALSPADLVRECLLRPLRELGRLRREASRPPAESPVEQARPRYAAALEAGVASLFAPRRTDCPLCGSPALSVVQRCRDLLSYKPGTFTVEGCGACGHLFLNPRPTLEGLGFYYGDVYDGIGEEGSRKALSLRPAVHEERAAVLLGRAEPRRWLDVGGAYGLFGKMGKRVFPDCTFDGLDSAQGIRGARRRGWFSRVTVGFFPACAPEMAGQYDVISMSHYLEHTLDPAAELDAAALALAPAGHLFIEVPDPASIPARLLGTYYLPWFSPQHLHFVSVENLSRMLVARGFSVELVQRGEAHGNNDLTMAATLLLSDLLPSPALPWVPRRTLLHHAVRVVGMSLGLPLVLLASLIDLLARPFTRRPGWSNTYRLLARKSA